MPLPKATVPKPIQHWFLDPTSVSRLREILDDPVFQTATATLVQSAIPTYPNVMGADSNNEKHCWLAGYSDFVRDLDKLTRPPASKNDLEGWMHIS